MVIQHSFFALTMILTILFMDSSKIPDATASTTYFYAYVQNLFSGELHFIDPTDPSRPALIRLLPLRQGLVLGAVYPSPNGQFIALIQQRSDDRLDDVRLSMYNVLTEEIEDIAIYPVYTPGYSGGLISEARSRLNPIWSSDSRLLAFNAYQPSEGGPTKGIDTYIWDNQEKTTNLVKTGEAYRLPTFVQESMTFSPDNNFLMIVNQSCYNLRCDLILENYDINVLSQINLVKTLLSAQTFSPILNGDICIQNWSPDGGCISFYDDCDNISEGIYKELFVWDLEEDVIIQITDNTDFSNYGTNEITYRHVAYSSHWITEQDLWVSQVSAPKTINDEGWIILQYETLSVSTSLYSVPTQTSTFLDNKFRSDWRVNPTSGQLVYRVSEYGSADDGTIIHSLQTIEITEDVEGKLASSSSLTHGYLMSWSPDGRYLSYVHAVEDNIFSSVWIERLSEVVFVNSQNQQARFRLPYDYSSNYAFLLVGWVVNPNL